MVFVMLHFPGGDKTTVNTDNIKFITDYNWEAIKASMTAEALLNHRYHNQGAEELPSDKAAQLKQTLDTLRNARTTIHFMNSDWLAARETQEEITKAVNATLAVAMKPGDAEATRENSQSEPDKPFTVSEKTRQVLEEAARVRQPRGGPGSLKNDFE